MLHMEEEATTVVHNPILVMIFKYGDNLKTYFLPEVVEVAKYNYWDNTLKIVMYKTYENISDTEESDVIDLNISLEFSEKTQEQISDSSKAN